MEKAKSLADLKKKIDHLPKLWENINDMLIMPTAQANITTTVSNLTFER